MKIIKRIAGIFSLAAIICASTVITASAYTYYSDGSIYRTDLYSTEVGVGSNAKVYVTGNVFTKVIKSEPAAYPPAPEYAVFATADNSETLTLGMISARSRSKDSMQKCVSDQINYIKSVGGTMTGYTLSDDGDELRISWNIGSEHHFACFRFAFYWDLPICVGDMPPIIGYYDLAYRDNGIAQHYLSEMYETFLVNLAS